MVLFPGCKCCGGTPPPETGWACYDCTPCLVVAFETAGTGDPANNTFNLGPYLTGHTAHAGRPYRFVEVGANCDGVDPDDPSGTYTWHGAGFITPDGTIGDPWIDYNPDTGIYTSSYPYRGYLRLQIGCANPEFPNDEYFAEYSDDCTDGPCETAPEGCEPAESLVMVQKFTVHSVSFSGLGYDIPDVPDTDYVNEIRNWLDGLEFRYSPYPGDSKIYASGGYETCGGCTPIPDAENTQGYLLAGVNNCGVSVGTTVGRALFPCLNNELWLQPEICRLSTSPQCSANLGLPAGYTMQLKFVPTVEANGFVKLANGVGSSTVLTPPSEEINGPPNSSPSTASAIVWISDTSNNPIQQYRVYALHLESFYTVTMNPLP